MRVSLVPALSSYCTSIPPSTFFLFLSSSLPCVYPSPFSSLCSPPLCAFFLLNIQPSLHILSSLFHALPHPSFFLFLLLLVLSLLFRPLSFTFLPLFPSEPYPLFFYIFFLISFSPLFLHISSPFFLRTFSSSFFIFSSFLFHPLSFPFPLKTLSSSSSTHPSHPPT